MPDTPDEDDSPLEITQASLTVQEESPATQPPAPHAPGDEAAPGSSGTAEGLCPACGGTGHQGAADQTPCPACEGTGKVTVGVGGG